MRLGDYCPGCGGGPGNQSCTIAKCSLLHDQVEYCYLCLEYPCRQYEEIEEYDSFITHQRQLRDIQRAQEIGTDAYITEQAKKAETLGVLLSDYNDGRRKTFYCVAVNLLPLENIETVMCQVGEDEALNNLLIKEKAEYVVSLLQNVAAEQGLVLTLRKKPSKK